jgi:hypothetical protein
MDKVPNEEIVPLDENKKIRVTQYNSVPNNLRYSHAGNPITLKEGVEFTFKKPDRESAYGEQINNNNLYTNQSNHEVVNNTININIEQSVKPFDTEPMGEDDSNALVSEEFKDSEVCSEIDNQSVVSSNISSKINRTLTKKPTSGTASAFDGSFVSFTGSVLFESQNLITENFLQKIKTIPEDEYLITNENIEGFEKFIETPKTNNIRQMNSNYLSNKTSSSTLYVNDYILFRI